MSKKSLIISITLAVLLVLQVGLLFLAFDIFHHHRIGEQSQNTHLILRTFFEGPTFYDSLFQAGAAEVPTPKDMVAAGIIPHHLIVGDKIAAFFLSLKKEKYDTIVLLSPDHFGVTPNRIMISGVDWRTPYGVLETDLLFATKIAVITGFPLMEDARFEREHGVGNETSFIKKIFPDTKMMAILIKKEAKQEDLDKLVQAIYGSAQGKKILVLASVDFSHDLTADEADKEDVISNKIIQNFSLDKYQEIKADCPAAVYAVMKYADLIGAREPQLVWNTNSGRLIGKPNEPTVSHNFYYFFKK